MSEGERKSVCVETYVDSSDIDLKIGNVAAVL